jgi:hypothetical protein
MRAVLTLALVLLAPLSAAAQHGGGMRNPFEAPPPAVAEPSAQVPVGTIRVLVTTPEGQPLPDATVLLGTMQQGGDRQRVPGTTNAAGIYEFAQLPTGSSQAYRINLPFSGATYSTTPFRLPEDTGYLARITALPVTQDDRIVLQFMGATYVELKESRLHFIQRVQLANMSQDAQTYVFPEAGLRIRLPEGYLAFQTQPLMTDQKVEEVTGQGVKITGSLPPGMVELVWAFDLPITGSDMDVFLVNPFRTYTYRVISEAPEGMRLELEGLPAPRQVEDQGRTLFGIEVQRRPGDPRFDGFTMKFRNIPQPSPVRWVAVGLAVAFILFGAAAARGTDRGLSRRSLAEQKRALLAEGKALDEEFERGEVGPEYRQSRHRQIVRDLAVVLHREQLETNKKGA